VKREELNLVIRGPNGSWNCGVETSKPMRAAALSSLEFDIIEGDNPVFVPVCSVYGWCLKSRIAWDCYSKWVVNFI
jgi:hypothetical protein